MVMVICLKDNNKSHQHLCHLQIIKYNDKSNMSNKIKIHIILNNIQSLPISDKLEFEELDEGYLGISIACDFFPL